jgi:hypothetical protein
LSYAGGQKFYPVPYQHKKILSYLMISAALVITHRLLVIRFELAWSGLILATIFMAGFLLFARKEILSERMNTA